LGFRPFFLLGALAAVILMVLWLAVLEGRIAPPAIDPVTWHAHEMVYGFAVAFVAGFILTASQNWTGLRGVHGRPLQVLTALWLLGRIAMWTYPQPRWIAALIDLAPLPLLAWLLRPYLGQPAQRRNRVLFFYLALLFAGNVIVHADLLGGWPGAARDGLWIGVYGVVFILVLIGGRVIPSFARNAVPGAPIRVRPWVEWLSHGSVAALALTVFLPPQHWLPRAAALAAAVIHGVRWAGWFAWPVLRRPILAILFVGYAWLAVGFALLGILPGIGQPPAVALHAFTVGGIGVVVYGMITRIALGHTGRPIGAGPLVLMGYGAMNLAALVRVAGPLLGGAIYSQSLILAGALWTLAFLLLLIHYTPILLRPRAVG
jgi:uncharacterized protein involved in response to NO